MGALQGDLGVLGLTVVLPALMEGRRRGTLAVSVGGAEQTFFLDPPTIEVLGAAARRLGPIDEALLRRGMLTVMACAETAAEQRKSGRPLHRLLLERNAVREEDLLAVLREFVEEELFEILTALEGAFQFVEAAPPDDELSVDTLRVRAPVELSYVLLESARRHDEWDLFRKSFPTGAINFRLTSLGVDFRGQASQDRVLSLVLPLFEKGHTLDEVVEETGLRRFHVWSSAHTLLNQGLLEPNTMRIAPATADEAEVFAPIPRRPTSRTTTVFERPKEKRVVLVADSQAHYRKIIRFLLERSGMDVLEAASGPEVIDTLDATRVHAVILDMVLPGADGPDLCRTIRARQKGRDLPVLFISANSRREDVLRAMQSGARDYVVKPFRRDVLVEKIRKAFEK